MFSKISVVIDDAQWSFLRVEKNQPGDSVLVGVDSQTGNLDSATIQGFLKRISAEKAQICLGISYRDLIVRSFVVPEMSSSELNKAIIFEIKKHIPFSIAEAYYSTMTFPFVENNNKMMRVLFYAARKNVIDNYKERLAKEGMGVTTCEPAICGLVRTMIFRKDIHPADKVALLDLGPQKSVIYFIDGGVVKFLREIPLIVDQVGEGEVSDPYEANNRFLNEIHNSFDFYHRQFGERFTDMLVVADDDWFASLEDFMRSVNVKCRKYSFSFVSGVKIVTEFSMSCAFGLGLTGNMFVPSVNLLISHKPVKKNWLEALNIDVKGLMPSLRLAIGAFILLGVVGGVLLFQGKGLRNQLADIEVQQGEFSDLSVKDIQGQIAKIEKDIEGIKAVPSASVEHLILLLIAQHMPKGMWFQEINISYNNSLKKVSVTIKASVYIEDVSQQAFAVNKFLSDLKSDKALNEYTSKWQLRSMSRKQDKNVTSTIFDLMSG